MHSTDSSRGTPFHCTLPGVLIIVATYAFVHATTRLLASGNLGEDDVFDTLVVQHLQAGYSVDRGPLYDWAIWSIQQIAGNGLGGFLALKYALLVAMAGALFLTTRRLTGSPLWAFIAVESMATVYQIFWRFHEGFTHRVGAMALVALTLLAAYRAVDRQRLRDFLALGALVGLGLLSEHIYTYFLLLFCITGLFQPGLRQRLLSPKLLAALLLTVVIALPYGLWLTATPERFGEFLAHLAPTRDAPSLAASLRDAVTFPIFVLSPYVIIVVATFPRLFKAGWARPASAAANGYDLQRWLGHLLALELLGHLLANGILFRQANYPVHSILPMLVIAIPWLTAAASQTAPTAKRVKVFMAILLAFTITAYGVRSGNLFIYEPFCQRCRWGTPYEELAANIKTLGFTQGAIVTNDDHTGGNLRRFLPDTPILLVEHDKRVGLEPAPGTPLLFIWPNNKDSASIPGEFRPLLPAHIQAEPQTIRLPWHPPFKKPGYRHSSWAIVQVDARQ